MSLRALLSAFAVGWILGGCADVEPRARPAPEPTLRPGMPGPLPLSLVLEKVEILDLDAMDAEKPSQDALPFDVEGSLRASYTDALLDGLADSGAFVRVASRDSLAFPGQETAADTAVSNPAVAEAAESAAETPGPAATPKPAATGAKPIVRAQESPAAAPAAAEQGATSADKEASSTAAQEAASTVAQPPTRETVKEAAAGVELPSEPAAEERDPFDLHLHARVFTVIKSLPPEQISTGTAVANSAAWFLLMVPGWFIPDHTYGPTARVLLEVRRSGSTSGTSPPGFDTGSTDLNFVDRAGVGEYFLQIIAPCALVPSNSETARETLLAEARKAVALQTEAYFKGRFAVDQARGGEPFLLPLACRSAERKGCTLFLPGEITSLEVDGGPAPGAAAAGGFASYAAACRQKQTLKTEALEDLQQHLSAMAPGEQVPSAPELDGKYPYVYFFADIGPGPGERRLRVTHKKAAGEDSVPASWTIPRLASDATETSRD